MSIVQDCYFCKKHKKYNTAFFSIGTSEIYDGAKCTYSFCSNCGRIYLFKHGFFGKKSKPTLAVYDCDMVGFINKIKDIQHTDKKYEDIIHFYMDLPRDMIKYMFRNGYLEIDELGLKDNYGCYGGCIMFDSSCSKEYKIQAYKEARRESMVYSTKDIERIKNNQFTEAEIPWRELIC